MDGVTLGARTGEGAQSTTSDGLGDRVGSPDAEYHVGAKASCAPPSPVISHCNASSSGDSQRELRRRVSGRELVRCAVDWTDRLYRLWPSDDVLATLDRLAPVPVPGAPHTEPHRVEAVCRETGECLTFAVESRNGFWLLRADAGGCVARVFRTPAAARGRAPVKVGVTGEALSASTTGLDVLDAFHGALESILFPAVDPNALLDLPSAVERIDIAMDVVWFDGPRRSASAAIDRDVFGAGNVDRGRERFVTHARRVKQRADAGAPVDSDVAAAATAAATHARATGAAARRARTARAAVHPVDALDAEAASRAADAGDAAARAASDEADAALMVALQGARGLPRCMWLGGSSQILRVYERDRHTDSHSETLKATWRRLGWDGVSRVTRTEFELRGPWWRDQQFCGLDVADGSQLSWRQARALLPHIATLVAERTRHGEWRVPSSPRATRKRHFTSPWWRAVQQGGEWMRTQTGSQHVVTDIVTARRKRNLRDAMDRAVRSLLKLERFGGENFAPITTADALARLVAARNQAIAAEGERLDAFLQRAEYAMCLAPDAAARAAILAPVAVPGLPAVDAPPVALSTPAELSAKERRALGHTSRRTRAAMHSLEKRARRAGIELDTRVRAELAEHATRATNELDTLADAARTHRASMTATAARTARSAIAPPGGEREVA